MSEFNLDFQDTATAFADKSDAELKEKYRLFRMLNSPFLNALGTRLAKFALSLGLPVEGLIKATIFEQFCGGETIEECEERHREARPHRISARSSITRSKANRPKRISTDQGRDHPHDRAGKGRSEYSVFGFQGDRHRAARNARAAQRKKKLDAKSQAKCERIHNRVDEICEHAYSIGQPVFIDAEDSWIQDAIDRLATEMMERFNRERPIVFNTLQMYRTDRLQYLKDARRQANGRRIHSRRKARPRRLYGKGTRACRRERLSVTDPSGQSGHRRRLQRGDRILPEASRRRWPLSPRRITRKARSSSPSKCTSWHPDRSSARFLFAALRNGRQHLVRSRKKRLQCFEIRSVRPVPTRSRI